jgi:apolipoprotein N-acyltransferase
MRPAGKPGDEARAITHLFWPEAPLPFVLDREPRALGALTRMLGNNQTLITGAIRSEEIGSGEIGGGTGNARLRYFNAIQHYDGKGLQSSYDKRHLVPFGEYLPFEAALRALGLRQFVGVIGGFTAATRAGQLQVPDLPPIVPMICFESIFPHEIETSGHGQQVIVNVTNDSWFGQTSGPYQHLAQARLRAIEFGHPLIRAANGGISTVFDPFGRVVDKLPLQAAGILDVPLPTGLESTLYRRTIQVSYGPVMMLLLLIALIGILRGAKRALRSRVGEGSTF